jgi:hypothetical protein
VGDAIHLDGEQHGNASLVQTPRQVNCLRGAPAMTVENDASVLLFFHREFSIAAAAQQIHDFLIGIFTIAIFKSFHIHADRIFLAQARGKAHFVMDHIIVPDKSPDKAKDDDRRRGRTTP